MYRALTGGEADVISAFSSDGRIIADHLVVLADPRHALPPYDAVILVSPARANDQRLLGALRPLIGAIPVSAMRAANYSVDRDEHKLTPAQAAATLAHGAGLDMSAHRGIMRP
jgi:osmoprotectant transport system permease protein